MASASQGGAGAAQCGLFIDRHVPKNGGSSMRSMMRRNAAQGNCAYLGYDVSRTWSSRVGFNHTSLKGVARLLGQGAPEATVAHQHLCIEAHVVRRSFWHDLAMLRAFASERSCTTLVAVRVREPFSWYSSFYEWAIRARQEEGDPRWGDNFTDWLPHNLQSKMLLWGRDANENPADDDPGIGIRTHGIGNRYGWLKPRAGASVRLAADHRSQLDHLMRHVDIAAPMESFDETVALISCTSGFLSSASYERTSPAPVGGYWTKQRQRPVSKAADLCAGEREAQCREAVRRAAPDDFELYGRVKASFEKLRRQATNSAAKRRCFERQLAALAARPPPAPPRHERTRPNRKPNRAPQLHHSNLEA